MKFPALFALSLALALPAFAQGPGGGGFNPGGGGGGPGGGGSSGTFTYDSIQSNVTNADATVSRNGLLFARPDTPVSIAPPSTVAAIADGLFAGCASLVAADLSATAITALPSDCFAGCTSLTTVLLPDTCTAIGPNAFAGCAALSSVTAPGVATIASDAFRGCTSLAALPAFPSDATLGPWSFSQSGLAALDLSSVAPSDGAFAGCASLATADPAPETLPPALFSGCTSLAFDPSLCSSIGQAALAGVPFDAIPLEDWEAVLAPYAFAADAATVDTLLDCSNPEYLTYDPTTFLGRTISYDTGNGLAPIEAADLVTWLQLQTMTPMSTVVQPASYATADLETWIAAPSNLDSLCLYTADPDLTVSGNTFLYTPPSAKATSVRVTLESTTNLLDAASWTPDALDLDPEASSSALLVYTTTNSPVFARLAFSPAW
jgi:hypothetical protein